MFFDEWIPVPQHSNVPQNLTYAQRKVSAGILRVLADRLETTEAAPRTISFALKEVREIASELRTCAVGQHTSPCPAPREPPANRSELVGHFLLMMICTPFLPGPSVWQKLTNRTNSPYHL